MTESNTPPENPKKKSAFSRFFSRKKSSQENQTEQSSSSADQNLDSPSTTVNTSATVSQPVDTSPPTEHKPPKNDSHNEPTFAIQEESANHAEQSENTSNRASAEQSTPNTQPQTPNLTVEESKLEPTASVETSSPEKTNGHVIKIDDAEKISLASPTPQNSERDNNIDATVEEGLDKSRTSFFKKISNVFKGSFDLDDDLFDELEELLITSDIGIDASLNLVEKLRTRVKSDKIQDAKGVILGLRKEIAAMLKQSEQEWKFQQKPYVIVMVGVNGAGKTTTTAKIAKHFQRQGKSVMLAAADTFRAAAVEQLQEWGKRLDIPVIAQAHGSDAAAVAHDALTSATARNIDILMIDTAGRLHTQSDLMEQLQKVNRVLSKIDPSTPHEVMQILDSGTGQNALSQLEHFQKAVGVSSICLTKLDGSAKGGVAISLAEKYKLPIRFIGVGEGFNDIKPFSANQFADALIPELDK